MPMSAVPVVSVSGVNHSSRTTTVATAPMTRRSRRSIASAPPPAAPRGEVRTRSNMGANSSPTSAITPSPSGDCRAESSARRLPRRGSRCARGSATNCGAWRPSATDSSGGSTSSTNKAKGSTTTARRRAGFDAKCRKSTEFDTPAARGELAQGRAFVPPLGEQPIRGQHDGAPDLVGRAPGSGRRVARRLRHDRRFPGHGATRPGNWAARRALREGNVGPCPQPQGGSPSRAHRRGPSASCDPRSRLPENAVPTTGAAGTAVAAKVCRLLPHDLRNRRPCLIRRTAEFGHHEMPAVTSGSAPEGVSATQDAADPVLLLEHGARGQPSRPAVRAGHRVGAVTGTPESVDLRCGVSGE